jgi:hypothetical protein
LYSGGAGIWHTWERREMRTEHWIKNLNLIARFKIAKPEIGPLNLRRSKQKRILKKNGLRGEDIIKVNLKETGFEDME